MEDLPWSCLRAPGSHAQLPTKGVSLYCSAPYCRTWHFEVIWAFHGFSLPPFRREFSPQSKAGICSHLLMAITCSPSIQQSRDTKVALWILKQYESTISLLCQEHSFPPARSFHLHNSYRAGAISVSPAAAIAAPSGSVPIPIQIP